ncbi:CBS domain-containing protein [Salipaludibacillus keqinensis]|uniref:CBS domain-containing protein n=1 Tax=Salipaludibacillus keqinensis TaxID=2045207 RepID=A0A323TL03_9BACI|nr:cyclic-di-AMP-binding protein CbpB [Salipaludibacillus keqinensis]PYZ94397.1 CBS domain-containing protein [Salipaludibacillus keqinensis]
MLKLKDDDVLNRSITSFIIPSDEVAHVQPDNNLEHALLVLVKSGYTAIPVLDHSYKLQGLISKAQILDSILGIERIEPEKLSHWQVKEVMTNDIACVSDEIPFEKVISLSINHPFVCVQDNRGAFLGIIPRSKILAYLNGFLHEQRKQDRS